MKLDYDFKFEMNEQVVSTTGKEKGSVIGFLHCPDNHTEYCVLIDHTDSAVWVDEEKIETLKERIDNTVIKFRPRKHK